MYLDYTEVCCAFSLPLVLFTPVTCGILWWVCLACHVTPFTILPSDMYWDCFAGSPGQLSGVMTSRFVYVGFIWYIGLLIITRYLWTPKLERLATMTRYLFSASLLTLIFIVSSILMLVIMQD